MGVRSKGPVGPPVRNTAHESVRTQPPSACGFGFVASTRGGHDIDVGCGLTFFAQGEAKCRTWTWTYTLRHGTDRSSGGLAMGGLRLGRLGIDLDGRVEVTDG
jgi:hypothetical protein